MATSREIYREWLRGLKDEYREFGIWQLENINDYSDINYHFNQFLIDLAMSLDEADNANPIKWLTQAETEVNKIKAKLIKKFPQIETELTPDEIRTTPSKIYNLKTEELQSTTGLKKRKRLFPDLASITDYISEVPYPGGIETVYSQGGEVIGYYLWVEK